MSNPEGAGEVEILLEGAGEDLVVCEGEGRKPQLNAKSHSNKECKAAGEATKSTGALPTTAPLLVGKPANP